MTQLAASYGYPALALIMLAAAAGVPLPVPVVALLVAAGALSAQPHGPSWALLALCGIPAAAAGHSLDYWLGRAGSPLVTRWMRRLERHLGGMTLHHAQHSGRWAGGPLLVFLTRWTLTALASPVAALAGAVRMPYRTFLGAEVAGETIYVCGLLALGRLLGPALPHNGLFSPALWIAVAVAMLAATALLPRLWRRLRAGNLAG